MGSNPRLRMSGLAIARPIQDYPSIPLSPLCRYFAIFYHLECDKVLVKGERQS